MHAATGRPAAITLIGCGAIGRAVLDLLRGDPLVRVTQVIVRAGPGAEAARAFCAAAAPQARVRPALAIDGAERPDLVVECAGHGALAEHVLPALAAGVPAIVASIGALHDAGGFAALEDAARRGGTRLTLVSGAVGGIDALAAARLGGLDEVLYIGRKPPGGWLGTPAEAVVDLAGLTAPAVIFEGSAREAARLYPKNANVAATVSLAGLGLDATRAQLIADPGIERNVHRVTASGAFGRLDLTIENRPLPDNPKTSALTVYSLVRAIRNATQPVML
ncbi:MAG: aspartate dehydrogenase [Lautropia sp.]